MWEITMQVDGDWRLRFAALDVGPTPPPGADDGERFGTPEEALAEFRLKADARRSASAGASALQPTAENVARGTRPTSTPPPTAEFRLKREQEWEAAMDRARKRERRAKRHDARAAAAVATREAEEREAEALGLCPCEPCCVYRREQAKP